jgi:hypothetical protein
MTNSSTVFRLRLHRTTFPRELRARSLWVNALVRSSLSYYTSCGLMLTILRVRIASREVRTRVRTLFLVPRMEVPASREPYCTN